MTNSFDGRGNYNMGITEQIVFPEIDFDKVTKSAWYGYCNNYKCAK